MLEQEVTITLRHPTLVTRAEPTETQASEIKATTLRGYLYHLTSCEYRDFYTLDLMGAWSRIDGWMVVRNDLIHIHRDEVATVIPSE
jgi:hypothetical protein